MFHILIKFVYDCVLQLFIMIIMIIIIENSNLKLNWLKFNFQIFKAINKL